MASEPSLDRKRYAIVGSGHRTTKLWAPAFKRSPGRDLGILVGICDANPERLVEARSWLDLNIPIYTDFQKMLRESRCETVIVSTPDVTHDHFIVEALEYGCDVITEKPLTTDERRLARIVDAERRTGHRVEVAFNYRYAPYATRVRQILAAGVIGEITAVEFQWCLDTIHGADYFRRWHRRLENSGGLLVHKSTHHFDLVNWWTGSEPTDVFARGTRRFYGANAGKVHGHRCSDCQTAQDCPFFWRLEDDPRLFALFRQAEKIDGYFRDGCVFDEQVDIMDTMSVSVHYQNGMLLTYTLQAYSPFEGYRVQFSGTRGRLECVFPEFVVPEERLRLDERKLVRAVGALEELGSTAIGHHEMDTIRFYPLFGGVEEYTVQRETREHYGGDDRMLAALFNDQLPDPLGHRAGTRAGALSILIGIAANRSIAEGRPIDLSSLWRQIYAHEAGGERGGSAPR